MSVLEMHINNHNRSKKTREEYVKHDLKVTVLGYEKELAQDGVFIRRLVVVEEPFNPCLHGKGIINRQC